MNFSEALEQLKQGNRLTRAGWNGASQYIYLIPAGEYAAVTAVAKADFGDKVPYGPYIAIKPTTNVVVPWVASQSDLLADDWEIVR